MKLRRKKTVHEAVEINITAFMNLMVILVPFLLITAVFSRMTVLELNLPSLNALANDENKKLELQLQMVVREKYVQLQDPVIGPIKRFDRDSESINWKPITEVLLEIKRRSPDTTTIALLLDKKISYRTLINIMDHVRSTELLNVGTLEEVELFPDVAIGDAPVEVSEAEAAEAQGVDALPALVEPVAEETKAPEEVK